MIQLSCNSVALQFWCWLCCAYFHFHYVVNSMEIPDLPLVISFVLYVFQMYFLHKQLAKLFFWDSSLKCWYVQVLFACDFMLCNEPLSVLCLSRFCVFVILLSGLADTGHDEKEIWSTCPKFILSCPDVFLLCAIFPLLWTTKDNRLLISSKYRSVMSLNVCIL